MKPLITPPLETLCAARFARDEKAAVAVVFALAAGVLMLVAGVAIDYASIQTRRTEAQAAADRAVLSAVRAAYEKRMAGDAQWKAIGQSAGLSSLAASPIVNTVLTPGALTVEDAAGGVAGNLAYSAEHKLLVLTSFKDTVVETGVATARVAAPTFKDVRFLVDVSSSMGIGATLADQTKMINANNCALACHYSAAGYVANYAKQRATGAQFRVDVVRNAIVNFLTDMQKQQTAAGELRVSIDVMSSASTQILAPTTDIGAAIAAAATIDVTGDAYVGGTNFSESFKQMLARTAPGGDGSSPSSRKSYVVILSDGIENSTSMTPAAAGASIETYDPNFVPKSPDFVYSASETVQTIPGSACKPFKDAKHTVLTGHIEYLIPADPGGWGVSRLDYIQNTLTPLSIAGFRDCASDPAFALTASTSADIEAMLAKMGTLIGAAAKLRLTK
jgi:Flp pilus assembly protein TadG